MDVSRRSLLKAGSFVTLLGSQFLAKPVHAQSSAGILRFGLSAFPPNLQPWVNVGAAAANVKLLVHRSLLAFDPKGELRGELAHSWSIDSAGAWVFKLRPNCFFHNGDPVTADDVKWSIEQIADTKSTAYMRTQFQTIAQIEIPDAETIRIVTKSPQATLPSWFANYSTYIISRKSTPTEAIGAGPFVISAQERGSSIDLAPFDKFYKPGLPKLKGIKFIVYADENLRFAALQSGGVDLIEYVPWQSMAAVEGAPRLKLESVEGPFMDILFNGTRPPFNDPRVRLAVALAIRRDEIVKAVFYGRGKPLEGVPIVEGTPWYDPALARGWAYNPERAKALLAEAGFAGGIQTSLLATAQYGMHKDTAELVQQHLAAIGIQCELQLPDWSTRVSRGTKGQYDIAIHGLAADSNDPDGLAGLLDTSLSPTHSRSFGLQAPRTAAAFAAGRAVFDQAARVDIYKEMQRAVLEEVPMASLAWRSQGYGMDRSVMGFVNMPGALTSYSGSTLEETFFG